MSSDNVFFTRVRPPVSKSDLELKASDLVSLVDSLEHLVAYGRDNPSSVLPVELLASLVTGHREIANSLYDGLCRLPDN